MDLQKEAVKLNKKIEKLTQILTDSTALTQAQRQAKGQPSDTTAGIKTANPTTSCVKDHPQE